MADMDPRIMAMPRVRFVCGRDWMYPGRHYEVGFYWDANPWPRLGDLIYRRKLTLRFHIDNGRYL